MTRKQEMCISEAVKNLQTARKWLDQAMYYSDEQMQGRDLKKTREAYDLVCSAIDKIGRRMKRYEQEWHRRREQMPGYGDEDGQHGSIQFTKCQIKDKGYEQGQR